MNSSERLEKLRLRLEEELDKYHQSLPNSDLIQAYAQVVMALTRTYGLV